MTCGIYLITNRANNKRYVGRSLDIERRWKVHLCRPNSARHLYRALQKYGAENFEFSILEECSEADLFERENYYIHNFQPEYNSTIAEENGMIHPTPETRAKLRLAAANRPPVKASTGEKISKALTGRIFSEEHKKNMSRAKTGDKNPMYGKSSKKKNLAIVSEEII